MLIEEFVIPNKLGLHARASALLVKTASRFNSDIMIEREGERQKHHGYHDACSGKG
jgi:phosphocarrier protein HPr